MRGCNEYVYDAFGNLVSSLGLISQSYGFGGYYLEEEVRLYLIGRRWYDPEVGRYISRNSPYLFSNNNPVSNPVSSLPVYIPPFSDITTPDNPKDTFQLMLPGSGGFIGGEIGFIGSFGWGNVYWCDSSCYLHFIEFSKICWGAYIGISFGTGVTTLPPKDVAIEISISIPPWPPSLGGGIDIGFSDEGFSFGLSAGWDTGIRRCRYYIKSDTIIGRCN